MKFSPSILAALGALAGIFAPQAQAFVAAHPQFALIFSSLYAIAAHFLPSPKQ